MRRFSLNTSNSVYAMYTCFANQNNFYLSKTFFPRNSQYSAEYDTLCLVFALCERKQMGFRIMIASQKEKPKFLLYKRTGIYVAGASVDSASSQRQLNYTYSEIIRRTESYIIGHVDVTSKSQKIGMRLML
jgi:hypothetical protein